MASPATMTPQGSGAPPQQGQGPSGSGKETIQEFRALAESINGLAGKYPEFTQAAAKMLPEIQKALAAIIGNPNRTPEKQPPPVGA